MSSEEKKAKFFQVYANLPLGSRREIIAVISGEPITWQVAKLEIELQPLQNGHFSSFKTS